jgi:hypothetical protein
MTPAEIQFRFLFQVHWPFSSSFAGNRQQSPTKDEQLGRIKNENATSTMERNCRMHTNCSSKIQCCVSSTATNKLRARIPLNNKFISSIDNPQPTSMRFNITTTPSVNYSLIPKWIDCIQHHHPRCCDGCASSSACLLCHSRVGPVIAY